MDYSGFIQEIYNEINDMSELKAFTWNPDPNKYPSTSPRTQYKTICQTILYQCNKVFDKYIFVPELTELGNIHIHGVFKIKNKYSYFKWFMPKVKSIGYVKLKTKVNEGWFDYISKEINLTASVIGDDLPIPLTHHNCSTYKKMNKISMKNRFTRIGKMPDYTAKIPADIMDKFKKAEEERINKINNEVDDEHMKLLLDI